MRKTPTPPRTVDGRLLAPRWYVAEVTGRHPELVPRHCRPVACDVYTRALLYDVDDARATLARLARVHKAALCGQRS